MFRLLRITPFSVPTGPRRVAHQTVSAPVAEVVDKHRQGPRGGQQAQRLITVTFDGAGGGRPLMGRARVFLLAMRRSEAALHGRRLGS
jgi:hypothetical protein